MDLCVVHVCAPVSASPPSPHSVWLVTYPKCLANALDPSSTLSAAKCDLGVLAFWLIHRLICMRYIVTLRLLQCHCGRRAVAGKRHLRNTFVNTIDTP